MKTALRESSRSDDALWKNPGEAGGPKLQQRHLQTMLTVRKKYSAGQTFNSESYCTHQTRTAEIKLRIAEGPL